MTARQCPSAIRRTYRPFCIFATKGCANRQGPSRCPGLLEAFPGLLEHLGRTSPPRALAPSPSQWGHKTISKHASLTRHAFPGDHGMSFRRGSLPTNNIRTSPRAQEHDRPPTDQNLVASIRTTAPSVTATSTSRMQSSPT